MAQRQLQRSVQVRLEFEHEPERTATPLLDRMIAEAEQVIVQVEDLVAELEQRRIAIDRRRAQWRAASRRYRARKKERLEALAWDRAEAKAWAAWERRHDPFDRDQVYAERGVDRKGRRVVWIICGICGQKHCSLGLSRPVIVDE